eukprot:IDg17873t1
MAERCMHASMRQRSSSGKEGVHTDHFEGVGVGDAIGKELPALLVTHGSVVDITWHNKGNWEHAAQNEPPDWGARVISGF